MGVFRFDHGQTDRQKKSAAKNSFFGKSFLYIKRNVSSNRASLYLAPEVSMRHANGVVR